MSRYRQVQTALLALAALVFLRGNGCGPDLLDNPSFDLWCGEEMCSWRVDSGAVQRVPTWHKKDYGVALIDDGTQISQLANLGEGRPGCFEFELMVDIDDNAEVIIEMDFQDDGTSEYSHPIPSYDWTPVLYKITPPSWYSSVRFIIRKLGGGHAVLAQIRARAGGGCLDDPLELSDRPSGAPCERGDQCRSDLCAGFEHAFEYYFAAGDSCAGCQSSTDCEPGQACGAEPSEESQFGALYECGPAGRHVLGERCITDEECASGICCDNVCSQCCEDGDCADGRTCGLRDWQELGDSYQVLALPHQCDPAAGTGEIGAPCLFDEDCASGTCGGEDELCLCAFEGWLCEARACEAICFEEDVCNERRLPLGKKGGICE